MSQVSWGKRLLFATATTMLALASSGTAKLSAQELRPDRLKPITEVNAALGERPAHYPLDQAPRRFAPGFPTSTAGTVRDWHERLEPWDATAFCHRPLYFEDENLERYGRSFGIAQPFVSATHFTGRFLAWPYLMGATPPHRCVYALGQEPPGSYAPYRIYRPPVSVRGALFEAGVISSLAYLVP